MERVKPSDVFIISAFSAIGALALAYLSTGSFSTARKTQIRQKYGYRSAATGEPDPHISIHHIWPQTYGGSDQEVNGVPLDHKTHEYWDQKTQRTGIAYPGIPVDELPLECFKNERIRNAAIRHFVFGEKVSGTIKFLDDRIEHFRSEKRKHKRRVYRGHRKGNKGKR